MDIYDENAEEEGNCYAHVVMYLCMLSLMYHLILSVEEKISPESETTATTKRDAFAENTSNKHKINAVKPLIAPAVRKIASDNNVCYQNFIHVATNQSAIYIYCNNYRLI